MHTHAHTHTHIYTKTHTQRPCRSQFSEAFRCADGQHAAAPLPQPTRPPPPDWTPSHPHLYSDSTGAIVLYRLFIGAILLKRQGGWGAQGDTTREWFKTKNVIFKNSNLDLSRSAAFVKYTMLFVVPGVGGKVRCGLCAHVFCARVRACLMTSYHRPQWFLSEQKVVPAARVGVVADEFMFY